jgi:hypothetical protein
MYDPPVPIRASSSRQIDALISDLGAERAITREAAIARLTLLGTRAVERLLEAAASARGNEARAAAWRALEGIGDARALEPALASVSAIEEDPAPAAAAAGVTRAHLRGPLGDVVVDRLTAVLLDRTRHESVRLASLRVLRELDSRTIAPILASLAGDPNATVRAEAGLSGPGAPRSADDPAAVLAHAAEGALPDDPAALRHALKLAGHTAPLSALKKVVDRVREREGSESPALREEWRLSRASAHASLAARRSRIALYDLRESIDAAAVPLPVEFLAALSAIGDASCLEAVAHAHAKAKDGWWSVHLARVFRDIVTRERLTKRHAALRRVEKRWPGALARMADS